MRLHPLLLFLFLTANLALQAKNDTLHLDSISYSHQLFGWSYYNGDDPRWADPAFDDSKWDTLDTELKGTHLLKKTFTGIGWFRRRISVDSLFILKTPLAFVIEQQGASEIYLDGHLLATFGKVSAKHEDEERYEPVGLPVALNLSPGKTHLLAIRYSNQEAQFSYGEGGEQLGGFSARLVQANKYTSDLLDKRALIYYMCLLMFGFFIALGLAHLLIYFFYRSKRSNLFYFFFNALLSYQFIAGALGTTLNGIHTRNYLLLFSVVDVPLFFLAFLALLYSVFYPRFPKQFWVFLAVAVLAAIFIFVSPLIGGILLTLLVAGAGIEAIRIIIVALRKRKPGSAIVGAGAVLLAMFMVALVVFALINDGVHLDGVTGIIFLTLLFLSIISIPISMSVYLARDFSRTSRQLQQKLNEVEELSAKNLEQEKEKQKILSTQNEMLEQQVQERTAEIVEQKKIIEEKNKDITDSISYARRIQQAMLPAPAQIAKLFPEAFVLNKPKDIVSGDFFWFGEKNGLHFAVLADCTGHGVPGALMSMIGHNLLDQIIVERGLTDPGKILAALHEGVSQALKQRDGNSETRDGMDVALLCHDPAKKEILFAGANRPLWMLNADNSLEELKGDKRSIGGLQTEEMRSFSTQRIALRGATMLYLSSDGYADQFGGSEGKKFMTKRFKELLVSIRALSCNEQRDKLEEAIGAWRGNREQVDDICVIGLRLS